MELTKKDLSESELHWLKQMRIGGGATLMLPRAIAEQLRAKGLAEQKLGGTGISEAGRRFLLKNK